MKKLTLHTALLTGCITLALCATTWAQDKPVTAKAVGLKLDVPPKWTVATNTDALFSLKSPDAKIEVMAWIAKEKGLAAVQEELGYEIYLKHPSIARWEEGEPTPIKIDGMEGVKLFAHGFFKGEPLDMNVVLLPQPGRVLIVWTVGDSFKLHDARGTLKLLYASIRVASPKASTPKTKEKKVVPKKAAP